MRFSSFILLLFFLILFLSTLAVFKFSFKNKPNKPALLFVSLVGVQFLLIGFLYKYFFELHEYFYAIAVFFNCSYDEIVIFLLCVLIPYIFIILVCYIIHLKLKIKKLRT